MRSRPHVCVWGTLTAWPCGMLLHAARRAALPCSPASLPGSQRITRIIRGRASPRPTSPRAQCCLGCACSSPLFGWLGLLSARAAGGGRLRLGLVRDGPLEPEDRSMIVATLCQASAAATASTLPFSALPALPWLSLPCLLPSPGRPCCEVAEAALRPASVQYCVSWRALRSW
jgi:hypothetical protein